MGWLQPGFNSDSSKESSVSVQCGHAQPEFNPGSSCSADVPSIHAYFKSQMGLFPSERCVTQFMLKFSSVYSISDLAIGGIHN